MTFEETSIAEAQTFVGDTNALTIRDEDRAALIATLRPIAERIPEAVKLAREIVVENSVQAEQAALLRDSWTRQGDEAENAIRQFSNGLLDRLFKCHRKGTGLIARFIPLKDAARLAKRKISAWQDAEAEKARREQERVQAEAEARTEAERRRLEKAAERLKTPELREARLAEAAAIVAPVVSVAPPPKVVVTQHRWIISRLDKRRFLSAVGASETGALDGFVDVDETSMKRAKAANPAMTIPGVEFKQISV